MPRRPDCLIIGCGDIGKRVARQAAGLFNQIYATTRQPQNTPSLLDLNIQPIITNLDHTHTPSTPTHWNPSTTTILYLAPPQLQGQTDRRIGTFLTALPALPSKLIYISTSGVYGDQQGAWVDENTSPNPMTDRAKRRHFAEQQLLNWQHTTHIPVTILRVPGIYGPGRLPLDKIRQGQPVIRPEEAPYTNLIHADDLAHLCLIAALQNHPGIYNVSDGTPIQNTRYYNTIADLAGLPRPPTLSLLEAQTQLPEIRLSFINESRRLNIEKMLAAFKPTLQYTDLHTGIQQALSTKL